MDKIQETNSDGLRSAETIPARDGLGLPSIRPAFILIGIRYPGERMGAKGPHGSNIHNGLAET